jgi:hypothetical protein
MTTRSPYDYIVQRQEDGWSQDFWLSDSESGRKEIARREAEALKPAPAVRKADTVTRADLDKFATEFSHALGKKFAQQRETLLEAVAGAIAETEKKFDKRLVEEHKRVDFDLAQMQVQIEAGLAALKTRAARLAEEELEIAAEKKRLKIVGGRS